MNASLALASAIALSLAIFAAPRIARAEEVDKIVASVDGEPITMHDVRAFAESAGKANSSGRSRPQNETFKEGLKGMIAQKLLAVEVAKYDDKIDEGQIDRYIADVEQERNISDQQLKQSLLQNGVSWDDFRNQAKTELAKAMMLNEELRQHVTIAPEEIQAYYDAHQDEFTVKQEKFQLAQILIAVPPNASPAEVAAAKAKADEVRKRAARRRGLPRARRSAIPMTIPRRRVASSACSAPTTSWTRFWRASKICSPGKSPKWSAPSMASTSSRSSSMRFRACKPLPVVKEDIRNHLVDQQTRARLESWVETDLVKQHDVETMY